MNDEKIVDKVRPVAWMGVDNEGHPNKFRLNFFGSGIPLFVAPDDMKLVEESEKQGSPCPEFWDWLPTAYNFKGDGAFTKYNMEVAFLAGKNFNPAPAVVRQPLTEEQIGLLTTDPKWSHVEAPVLLEFTRAIERAHGIGGNDD